MPDNVTFINLNRFPEKCALCGEWAMLDFCVPFYEAPVHEEIGTILPNGDEVGGMTCCRRCHDKHHELIGGDDVRDPHEAGGHGKNDPGQDTPWGDGLNRNAQKDGIEKTPQSWLARQENSYSGRSATMTDKRVEAAARPLFVDGACPTKHIERDRLWQLLATGTASEEDQRFAAGWIAKLTTADAAVADEARALYEHGRFLLDRLADLDIPEELARDWMGHVEPAIARFRIALAAADAAVADEARSIAEMLREWAEQEPDITCSGKTLLESAADLIERMAGLKDDDAGRAALAQQEKG